MEMKDAKKVIKPFAWGAVSGGVLLLIFIFSTGWVVTSSTAKVEASEMSAKAVVTRLAPVCFLQFQQDPNKEERLQALIKTESWERDTYVKKIGWATMPGEKAPSDDVAEECTKLIMASQEKSK